MFTLLHRPLVAAAIGLAGFAVSSGAQAALIHHYTFDSGTVAVDSVGGADGTLFNGATISGGVLSLDGSDDYVETLGNYIVPGSGDFTISMFAQQRAFAAPGNYVELISQEGGHFYLGYDPSHNFRISDAHLSTGVPFPTDGNMHNYALTYAAGLNALTLYIDGASVLNTTGVGVGTGGTFTRFGRQFDGHSEYYNGTLDDIRVYDTALSADEIRAIANPQTETETGVPAPASLALVGLGLVALAARRRRTA